MIVVFVRLAVTMDGLERFWGELSNPTWTKTGSATDQAPTFSHSRLASPVLLPKIECYGSARLANPFLCKSPSLSIIEIAICCHPPADINPPNHSITQTKRPLKISLI